MYSSVHTVDHQVAVTNRSAHQRWPCLQDSLHWGFRLDGSSGFAILGTPRCMSTLERACLPEATIQCSTTSVARTAVTYLPCIQTPIHPSIHHEHGTEKQRHPRKRRRNPQSGRGDCSAAAAAAAAVRVHLH